MEQVMEALAIKTPRWWWPFSQKRLSAKVKQNLRRWKQEFVVQCPDCPEIMMRYSSRHYRCHWCYVAIRWDYSGEYYRVERSLLANRDDQITKPRLEVVHRLPVLTAWAYRLRLMETHPEMRAWFQAEGYPV